MKIRTDFVTNSSSSSFVLSIRVELTDGNVVSFQGTGSCGEGAASDFGELNVSVSPRQLGKASSIQELVSLLKSGVAEDDNTPIFNTDDPKRQAIVEDAKTSGSSIANSYEKADAFISRVKAIPSMDAIAKITIVGNEFNYREYLRKYEYDRASDRYTKRVSGYDFDKNGGSGGDLIFSDADLAVDDRTLETFELTSDVNRMVFKGKRFVTTGFSDLENRWIENEIKQRGGIFGKSVGPMTYCLIVNPEYGRTTEKYNRAIAYNKGADLSFKLGDNYVITSQPRTGDNRIRIVDLPMLRQFLKLEDGQPLKAQ